MRFRNWKLSLLAILFMALFVRLGFWQLSRANEKQQLLDAYASRMKSPPLHDFDIHHPENLRFQRVELTGEFDNAHSFLLDNKIVDGKIGYEVYTPFISSVLPNPILIDRGFIPIGISRKQLPDIKSIDGKISLIGMLNLPPAYVSLGKLTDSSKISWPLRVEYINLKELAGILHQTTPVLPYVLNITPDAGPAYQVKWEIVSMTPEKHRGYALQWFAFAITLLILFVALNRRGRG